MNIASFLPYGSYARYSIRARTFTRVLEWGPHPTLRKSPSMNSVGEREAAIAHMAESSEAVAALRQHVQEIADGAAFKGSHRSAQFLGYIVEHAIAGNFDSLKERMIGMELFGRSPSYDTSEDAIVRVTASDVRKRLLQHYGRHGTASDFRISLPIGSYVPEIVRSSESYPAHPSGNSVMGEDRAADSPQTGPAAVHEPVITAAPEPPLSNCTFPEAEHAGPQSKVRGKRWLLLAAIVAALNLAFWAFAWKHLSARAEALPVAGPPWSAFFASSHPTHFVASDPDIEAIQVLSHTRISVSDYANRRYLPQPNNLPPIVQKLCIDILHGDKASTVDTQVAVDISALARSYGRKIDVLGARDLQISNLKTDDNFIFLGSPISNPWSSVFDDQLDFRFVSADTPSGKSSGIESIRNFHPRAGESTFYLPSAKGGGTGESFAIVALVANPDQSGQVLLLAGADREGTQAAGRLVTDLPRLAAAMQMCGIAPSGPARHFELLLRVDTMAGYPTQSVVAVCHLLPGSAAR